MRRHRILIPTYYGGDPSRPVAVGKEFGPPQVPLLAAVADGLRIVMGSHDYNDMRRPDILIERRPQGWAIFLHAMGGGDPSGCLYFLDDGRCYLWREPMTMQCSAIEEMDHFDAMPESVDMRHACDFRSFPAMAAKNTIRFGNAKLR